MAQPQVKLQAETYLVCLACSSVGCLDSYEFSLHILAWVKVSNGKFGSRSCMPLVFPGRRLLLFFSAPHLKGFMLNTKNKTHPAVGQLKIDLSVIYLLHQQRPFLLLLWSKTPKLGAGWDV